MSANVYLAAFMIALFALAAWGIASNPGNRAPAPAGKYPRRTRALILLAGAVLPWAALALVALI